jgi:ribosomal protein S12 methylthiotransferase accessory factor YcaO
MTYKEQLQKMIQELENRNILPSHIDIAQIGALHFVNLYNHIDSKMIASSATTGMDKSLEVATLKALSEFIERLAFQEGFFNKNPFCQTERSDGFAAYPKISSGYETKAKNNALNEAIERFVWASWWDDSNISHEIKSLDPKDKDFFKDSVSLLSEVEDLLGIDDLKMITPHFEGFPGKEVIIFACETIDQGVITGGACGNIEDRDQTILRAIGELSRHALAIYKAETEDIKPESFYERRLFYFMSEEGFSLYQNRIKSNGNQKIKLPKLKVDNEIKHEFLDLFYVHRCLFEDQPSFIGGNLERLCL